VPKSNSMTEQETVVVAQVKERTRGAIGAAVESVAPRPRRRFSAAEKLRILNLAEACRAGGERGALEAMMRAEGIYSSHLASWRTQLGAYGTEGLVARKPGRKPKLDAKDRRNIELEKRNVALERELHILKVLVDLQKKAHQILGIACPSIEESS
jgi:transposase